MSWYERRHCGGLRKAYHRPKDNLGFDWLIIPLLSLFSRVLRLFWCETRFEGGQKGGQVLDFNHPPEALGRLAGFHFNLIASLDLKGETACVAFRSPSPQGSKHGGGRNLRKLALLVFRCLFYGDLHAGLDHRARVAGKILQQPLAQRPCQRATRRLLFRVFLLVADQRIEPVIEDAVYIDVPRKEDVVVRLQRLSNTVE